MTTKKIRFPLEMKNGVMVRTLHDLIENFDLERVLVYLKEGKLEVWLRDRMQGDMADKIHELDVSDEKLGQKVCEIIFSVGSVAFDQDDLYDILEEGGEKIYLLGEEFEIPLGKENVTYIGLNQPVILVNSKEVVDWETKGIKIRDCQFDENYQMLLSDNSDQTEYIRATHKESLLQNDIAQMGYIEDTYMKSLLLEGQTDTARSYFDKLDKLMSS